MNSPKICIRKQLVKYFLGISCVVVIILSYFKTTNTLLTQKKTIGTKAIYKGTQSLKNSHPYFVKLITPNGICGGFLIGEYYVLTAAHCVYKTYIGSGAITALIGVDAYSGQYEGHGISIIDHSQSAPKIFIPKEYEPKYEGLDYDYDIALIRLNDRMYNIPYLSFPGPTDFPEKANIDKSTIVIGIGTASFFSSTASKYLMEASLYIRSVNSMGVITLNSKNDSIKKSTCRGDSGGPALFSIDSRTYSIGVVKSGWCGKSNSLITSTSFNSKWITDTSGIQPNSGTSTPSMVIPTQQPLVNVCYSRWNNQECARYGELCKWDMIKNICVPK